MLIITCEQFDEHIVLPCRKMAFHYLGNLTQLFHYMGKIMYSDPLRIPKFVNFCTR